MVAHQKEESLFSGGLASAGITHLSEIEERSKFLIN